MKNLCVAFFFSAIMLQVHAQQTELFVSTQSGDPFENNIASTDRVLWNYSVGVEQYFVNKISLGISYRKPFFLEGDNLEYDLLNSYNGFDINYNEDINMYAIDLESKYFFDDTDDGWYLSSGISYQHIEITYNITSIYTNNGSSSASPVPLGTSIEDVSLFPLSIKAGHRSSGDVVVFDYYFGLTDNLGSGSVVHKYENYLPYDSFKSISIILGIKMGFKF